MSMIKDNAEKTKLLYKRYAWAKDTRDSYRRPEWLKISKYLSPAHGRFFDERDHIPAKGKVDRNNIINSTATRAKSIAVAGIKGGLVPHSLKWFKLGLYDEDLEAWDVARNWLHTCEKVMYSVFNRSNFYESVYLPFDEQLSFGTGPFQIEEHPERIIHCDPWTCGEYALMNGPDKIVDTGFRKYWMTLRTVEKRFGYHNMSNRAQNMFNNNNKDEFISVIHCTMPRADYDPNKLDAVNMPWASIWFEEKNADNTILGESGYVTKPTMYPRWMTIGEDPYGSDCPGMMTLGDNLMLQRMEKDKLLALALVVRPPMNVPSNLYGMLDLSPGAQNKTSGRSDNKTEQVERTLAMDYDIERIGREIMNTEQRIKDGFFNDLFLMILESEKSGTTAYEIARKNEEKLVLLGPVVERQNSEMLNPAIERVFDICMRRGLFPEIPEELQGQEIRIEYVSMLAQAQKAVGITGIDRTIASLSPFAEMFPEIRHKFKPFDVVDEVAELNGMSPKLLYSSEEAQRNHQREQAALAQAQQMEQAAMMATTARDFSQASLPNGDNALNRITDQLPAA